MNSLSTTISIERIVIGLILTLQLIALAAIWFGPPWTFALIFLGIVGAAVLIVLRPIVGLFLCIFMLFSTIGGIYLQQAFKPLLLLTILAWFLGTLHLREIKFVNSSQHYLIASFIVVALISVFFADNLDRAMSMTGSYLKLFLFYFIAIMIVSSRSEIKPILWIMVIAGSLAALIGLYQTFFGAAADSQGQTNFLLSTRTETLTHDPNYLALITVPLIPLAVGLLKIDKSLLRKIFLTGLIAILAGTTILTLSRMGMLCLFFLLIMILYKERRHKKLVISAILAFILMIFLIPENVIEGVRIFQDFRGDDSVQQRLRILNGGFNMFLDHPIFGVGIGNFLTQSLHYTNTLLPRLAHNTFLEIMAEMGIFGLVIFVAIIFYTLKDMSQLQKFYQAQQDEQFLEFIRSIRISFLVFLVGSLFLTAGPITTFWMLVALTVIMKKLSFDVHHQRQSTAEK